MISIDLIQYLINNYGYFFVYTILFILKCFEGPIVITIAAFAASLGYLNIWIVFILGVLSGVIPDLLLYVLGRNLRVRSVERIVGYFGLSNKRVKWLEKKIKEHSIKSLIIVKHIPPLPIPGLILIGFMKMDFKKFFFTQAVLNTLGVCIFVILGFYSGLVAIEYLKLEWILFPIIISLIFAGYFLSRYISRHLLKLIKEM